MTRRPAFTCLTALAAPVVSVCLAGGALAQDRYGPPPPADPADQTNPAPAQPTEYLYWPSKPTAAPTPAPRPVAIAAQTPPQPQPSQAPAYAPAPMTRDAGDYASGLMPRAAPTAPIVAAQPAQGAQASQGALPPKFYSVQRESGAAPPAALAPQFFADSSATDLAEPPPAPAPPLLNGQAATSATTAAIRQRQADAASSPDGGAPSN